MCLDTIRIKKTGTSSELLRQDYEKRQKPDTRIDRKQHMLLYAESPKIVCFKTVYWT